ncbi:hypothetical protein JXA88_14670 [Candidatus Fermentibacteria bacterium]|nr:hypothetical protein [Candidatus Fermentibacteria bacterium]
MTEMPTVPRNDEQGFAPLRDPPEVESPFVADGGLSAAEEEAIRQRARARLRAQEEADRARERARQEERLLRLEAERLRWQIVEDETERFHRERGRVRYVSSGGQVLWLSPDDISTRRAHRVRGRRKGRSHRTRRTGSVIAITLRVAGVSLAIAFGLILVLGAAIYIVEYA